MRIKDRATILSFHKDRMEEFGKGSIGALGWLSPESQEARYKSLAGIGDLSNKSLLDVGCGHGDLYTFLSAKYPNIQYTGLDHMPEVLDIAFERFKDHPQVKILQGDFWQVPLPKADYVIACGALSYRHSDPNFLESMITKLYDAAKIAMGFTLLSDVYEGQQLLVAHQSWQVLKHCRSICEKVEFKDDYWADDFTVFLKK